VVPGTSEAMTRSNPASGVDERRFPHVRPPHHGDPRKVGPVAPRRLLVVGPGGIRATIASSSRRPPCRARRKRGGSCRRRGRGTGIRLPFLPSRPPCSRRAGTVFPARAASRRSPCRGGAARRGSRPGRRPGRTRRPRAGPARGSRKEVVVPLAPSCTPVSRRRNRRP